VIREFRFKSDFDVFALLANMAIEESHFAFYVNNLKHFELALGAEQSISITQSKGAFKKLIDFQRNSTNRIAGYLGYDLKNDLEDLQSKNSDELDFPEATFFEPRAWLSFKDGLLNVRSDSSEYLKELELSLFQTKTGDSNRTKFSHSIQPVTSKEAYLQNAEIFQSHLKRGDIYEANYCIQFAGDVTYFEPVQQFVNLQSRTEAPFSLFAGFKDHYILSASPERYLKNRGGSLISQPIKGTMKRSADPALDQVYKEQLRYDLKEQSENVMIVDLVRNDLSRVAARGSVNVPELFGAKTFKTVHHLVSTVGAILNEEKYNHWDAIRASFPMGSMTGAPKISAMKLIDQYESFKRSAYSGAFGWMDPNGDFDFNVMIRTIFYNKSSSKVSFAVGSALTIKAIPENEYDECMLKAKALIESLESASIADGITSEV